MGILGVELTSHGVRKTKFKLVVMFKKVNVTVVGVCGGCGGVGGRS